MKNITPEPGYTNAFVLCPNTGLSINKDGINGYTDVYASTNGKILYFNYGVNSNGDDTGLILLVPADSYTFPQEGATPQVNCNIAIPGLKDCKVTIGVWINPDMDKLDFIGKNWYDLQLIPDSFKVTLHPPDKSFPIIFKMENNNPTIFFNFSAVHPTTDLTWELEYIRVDYNV